MVVSDIESAKGWINFLCIGYFDGLLYKWFNNLDDYFHYIFNDQDQNSIYFHFGGGYDFLFLIDHSFRSAGFYTVKEFIPRGSSFLCIKICDISGRTITFLDSSALLPFALRDLAINFGVQTLKGDIDYDKIKKITPELLKYMEDDHRALWEVLKKYSDHPMIKKVGLKMTRSGQAFALFNQHYLTKKIIPLRNDVERFCRLAYQGGRTEIFKPLFLGGKDDLDCIDVNSLYPYVMKENEYPIRFNGFSCDLDLDVLSIWHVRVKVPMMKIPPLGIVHDGKYIFPVGEFEGYWTNVELKMAIKYGCKIIDTKMGAVFNNGGKIFSKYIDEMYELRKQSQSNSADNIIYKDMMNHLYGRFGLDKEKQKIVIDEGQAGVRPYMDIDLKEGVTVKLALEDTELKTMTFVPIPVFVTAYARIHNYENYLKPYEDDIYYTDTDSFFLPSKICNKIIKSNELGAVKLEYSMKQACFLLPKTYIAVGTTGKIDKIVKMKGFDKKKIQHFQMDDFINCLEGTNKLIAKTGERISRFKESLRRNKKVLSVLKESTKKINSKYNKRTIIKNKKGYDTNPLIIYED